MEFASRCTCLVIPTVCLLLCGWAFQSDSHLPLKEGQIRQQVGLSMARELLREASELVQQQPQVYSDRRLLCLIGSVQLRANDLLGAQDTLQHVTHCGNCLLMLDKNVMSAEEREKIILFARRRHFRLGWEHEFEDQPAYLRWNRFLVENGDTELRIKRHLIRYEDAIALSLTKTLESKTDQTDQILQLITRVAAGRNNIRVARAACEMIHGPSRKASAALKVATAYCRLGNRREGENIARCIELTATSGFYRGRLRICDPKSWGQLYDHHFTLSLLLNALDNAAELSADAMAYSLSHGSQLDRPFEEYFCDFDADVIQSLARAHAAHGDPIEAAQWVRRIAVVHPDRTTTFETAQGLVGVAEGIIERVSSRRLKHPMKSIEL